MARALVTAGGRRLNTGDGVLGASLRIPFRIKALTAIPASSPVTWFQPFARGDVPPGWRVALTTASRADVPVQQDQEVTWPMDGRPGQGSLRGAALSFLTTEALAPDEIATFRISRVFEEPKRVGHVPLDAVRTASDLRIEMRGLDLGTDVMELRFNEVVTNYAEVNAATSWGKNPVGGWEVIRSGPICVEWLAWRYTRRVSDGAQHKWQKAQMYLRQWVGGQREITPVLSQPNAYAAHPASAAIVGPATQGRIACYVELFDGATRLHSYSGPNAKNAVTVPTTSFNAATNRLTLPAPANTYWGLGSGVGFSGTLPTGLSATAAYFPYQTSDETNPDFNAARTLNGAYVTLGTIPATGNVTVMPICQTYPSCAAVLMDQDAHPFWQGVTPRPNLLVAHDEVYLTRRTRTVPPYDLDVPRPNPDPNAKLRPYHIGAIIPETKALDDTGDDLNANRIGYLPVTHCASLLLPFDAVRERITRIHALQWAGYTLWCDDHGSGRPVVATNGQDRVGSIYPGLGPCNPGFRMYAGDNSINAGSPPWGGYRTWRADGNSPNHAGFFPSYGIPLDGSHLPDFTTVAYLRTGHHVHAMTSLATACAGLYGSDKRRQTVGGKAYYGVILNSGRTQGWIMRALGAAECLVPSSHPSRAMLRDALDDCAAYWRDFIPTTPARFTGLHWDSYSVETRPWMQAMFSFCVGMEVWRDTRPAWRTLYESLSIYHVDGFDDFGSTPNAGWLADAYTIEPRDSSGAPWSNIAAMNTQYGPPFPSEGMFRQYGLNYNPVDSQGSYPAMHAATLAMMETNDALGLVAAPGAGRVRRQQIRRRTRAPLSIKPFAVQENNNAVYMVWAVVPVNA